MPSKKSRKITKKAAKKSKKLLSDWVQAPRQATTMNDVKTAIILVSVTINLAIFIGWLILRLTTVYDAQVYDFLFNR